MKTREFLQQLMNKATNNPNILDMDIVFPNYTSVSNVNYIYVEDNKLMLDC